MEAAHEISRRVFIRSAEVSFGAVLLVPACGHSGVVTASGRAGAQYLVEQYARRIGAQHRMLDQAGEISFGSVGFQHNAAQDSLIGRAFVIPVLIDDAPPVELANYRMVAGALNDPRIGGMFDRGGGTFILDEKQQGFFLVRAFPVASTTPDALFDAMETLQEVAAVWTTKWMYRVAMIAHGNQPPPTHPVTRANPD
jgi:hypothetical protein